MKIQAAKCIALSLSLRDNNNSKTTKTKQIDRMHFVRGFLYLWRGSCCVTRLKKWRQYSRRWRMIFKIFYEQNIVLKTRNKPNIHLQMCCCPMRLYSGWLCVCVWITYILCYSCRSFQRRTDTRNKKSIRKKKRRHWEAESTRRYKTWHSVYFYGIPVFRSQQTRRRCTSIASYSAFITIQIIVLCIHSTNR